MANTESSAVIRFINQVQSQPIFDPTEPAPESVPRPNSGTLMVQRRPSVLGRRGLWALGAAVALGLAVGGTLAMTGETQEPGPADPVALAVPPSGEPEPEPAPAPALPTAADGEALEQTDGPALDDGVAGTEVAIAASAEPAEIATDALLGGRAGDAPPDEPGAEPSDEAFTAGFDILVEPRGALVTLDGNELGAAPLRVGRLAAGAHSLAIAGSRGFVNKTLEVELVAGERRVIEVVLDAVAVKAHFDSEPRGAMVTLIADGEPTILGRSPVNTELDPSRSYQVLFSMDGFEVQTRRVAVEPGTAVDMRAVMRAETQPAASVQASAPAVKAPATAAKAPATAVKAPATAVKASATAAKAPAPAAKARPPAAKARPPAAKAPPPGRRASKQAVGRARPPSGADGILMLGAKPPCRILVDGRDTGLITPQRSIALSPGRHKITLVNSDVGIKRTFSVTIQAGETTRVIKDLL